MIIVFDNVAKDYEPRGVVLTYLDLIFFFFLFRCDSDINECVTLSPCQHDGVCVNKPGSFRCECPDQFVGELCENFRLITCESEPCKNGSTCTDIVNSKTGDNYTCTCMTGFEGTQCDLPYCQVQKCQNGGTCDLSHQVLNIKFHSHGDILFNFYNKIVNLSNTLIPKKKVYFLLWLR